MVKCFKGRLDCTVPGSRYGIRVIDGAVGLAKPVTFHGAVEVGPKLTTEVIKAACKINESSSLAYIFLLKSNSKMILLLSCRLRIQHQL